MHAIPSTGDAKSMWRAVSGNRAPFIAKIIVSPIKAIIYLLSWGSFFWLDLIYGLFVCFIGPSLLISLFSTARFRQKGLLLRLLACSN